MAEFEAAITELGDKLATLTLKQAVDVAEYLKETYGIEPAAGGAVMMAGPADGGAGGDLRRFVHGFRFGVTARGQFGGRLWVLAGRRARLRCARIHKLAGSHARKILFFIVYWLVLFTKSSIYSKSHYRLKVLY